MNLWLGFAITTELWRAVRRRGHPARGEASPIPPGSIAFVPTCLVLVGFAGILIAILGSRLGVVLTVALYMAVGLLYGVTCWLYAKNGYLPFPQE